MKIICSACSVTQRLDTHHWLCPNCGGLFEIGDPPRFDPSQINTADASLWRYRAMIPLPAGAQPVTMGEGFTPLVETQLNGLRFFSKLDYLNPSGSFKDRGTTVIVSALKAFGVTHAMDDSSGNAAASLSAYAARAGIAAKIFVPAHASGAKLVQIEVYGAHLNRVEGPRENAAQAVQDAARRGDAYYASHYYNPFVLAGMKTTAWEIWEQLGRRAPDAVFAPVGHGSNFIGIARGFQDLLSAGLIAEMPRLFAAQAEIVAPLARAVEQGLDDAPKVAPAQTIAEGIAITKPVRGKEILRAVKETRGGVIAVSEAAIADARNELARAGLYVEPTSATAIAALRQARGQFREDETVVVTLTGSGLKSQ